MYKISASTDFWKLKLVRQINLWFLTHQKASFTTFRNSFIILHHTNEVSTTMLHSLLLSIRKVFSIKTLKSVYYFYFHSAMTYGIMFWGNSTYAERVFKIQKRVIRVMKRCAYTESCREHFKNMKIFLLRSQYIYSLLLFILKNKEVFDINRDCYEINTRHNKDI
jgi:hypothetical protein